MIGDAVLDALGPLNGKAPRWAEKVFNHECIQIGSALKPVGVQVNQLAAALVESVEIEGRAGDWFMDAPAPGKSADEGRFACAEIAVQGQYMIFWHERCKPLCQRFSVFRRRGYKTVEKLL